MEVRVGVTYTPKELEVELGEGADREQLVRDIEGVLGDERGVLWLTDKKGRSVGVPVGRIAYVEISSDRESRQVGFGAG